MALGLCLSFGVVFYPLFLYLSNDQPFETLIEISLLPLFKMEVRIAGLLPVFDLGIWDVHAHLPRYDHIKFIAERAILENILPGLKFLQLQPSRQLFVIFLRQFLQITKKIDLLNELRYLLKVFRGPSSDWFRHNLMKLIYLLNITLKTVLQLLLFNRCQGPKNLQLIHVDLLELKLPLSPLNLCLIYEIKVIVLEA